MKLDKARGIKLDKAISRLKAYLRWRKPDPDDNFWESVQLGIEALKREQSLRENFPGLVIQLLPGETEE